MTTYAEAVKTVRSYVGGGDHERLRIGTANALAALSALEAEVARLVEERRLDREVMETAAHAIDPLVPGCECCHGGCDCGCLDECPMHGDNEREIPAVEIALGFLMSRLAAPEGTPATQTESGEERIMMQGDGRQSCLTCPRPGVYLNASVCDCQPGDAPQYYDPSNPFCHRPPTAERPACPRWRKP